MDIDLIGRIANIQLSKQKPLIPLLEAVINSIQSIEARKTKRGFITITIVREEVAQDTLDHTTDMRPVKSFLIEDNGVGFTAANYKSFRTSDTKTKPGAKGIGRFMWLKAFESVKIDSVFSDEGGFHQRKFDFVLSKNGVENHELRPTSSGEPITRVTLEQYKPPYQEHCPRSIHTIAERIIDHCLIYFLGKDCPQITLRDAVEKISLNKLYEDSVKGKSNTVTFNIKDEAFTMVNLRLYLSDDKQDLVHLCANDRDVKSIHLVKRIPDLKAKLYDEDQVPFRYAGYVSGNYLDENVNPERTDFFIPIEAEEDDFVW
jgi:hypothetical protein